MNHLRLLNCYHPFTLRIPSELLLSLILYYSLETKVMYTTRLLTIPMAKRHFCGPLVTELTTEMRPP